GARRQSVARVLPCWGGADLRQAGLERRNLPRRRARTGPSYGPSERAASWPEPFSRWYPAIPRNGSELHRRNDATRSRSHGRDLFKSWIGGIVFRDELYVRPADTFSNIQLSGPFRS